MQQVLFWKTSEQRYYTEFFSNKVILFQIGDIFLSLSCEKLFSSFNSEVVFSFTERIYFIFF